MRLLVAELQRKEIAARIQQARNEAGLSQEELADLLGIRQRTLQNYESVTKPRVPWRSIGKIAEITGTTTKWLLHGEAPDLMTALNGDAVTRLEAKLARVEEQLDELLEASRSREVLDAVQKIARVLEGSEPGPPQAPPGDDEEPPEAEAAGA